MAMGEIIGGFVVILIGVNLLPSVADAVYAAQGSGNTSNTNVTGAAYTIVGLSTIFYALGIMSAGVSLAVNGFKRAGIL
jgi:hypothetical protein